MKETKSLFDTITISELSKLCNTPYDTIRYWAEKGFISRKKNPHNNYYEYGYNAVGNLFFYKTLRECGFTSDTIRKYLTYDANKALEILEQQRLQIINKINNLYNTLNLLSFQELLYKKALTNDETMVVRTPDFEKVVEISLHATNIDSFFPWDCATVIINEANKNKKFYYGIVKNDIEIKAKTIWQKKSNAVYFNFIEKIVRDDDTDEHITKGSLHEKRQQLINEGYNISSCIRRFIMTATNENPTVNQRLFYYDTWIETIPDN